jgi:hypothetical protein
MSEFFDGHVVVESDEAMVTLEKEQVSTSPLPAFPSFHTHIHTHTHTHTHTHAHAYAHTHAP